MHPIPRGAVSVLLGLLLSTACAPASSPALTAAPAQPALLPTVAAPAVASPASAPTAPPASSPAAAPTAASPVAAAPPSPVASPTAVLKTSGPQLGWDDAFASNGKLNVATTVAPLSSIARNIGGDRINLHGIIPDGTDSHTFEPAPGDVKIISGADLVIVNGLHLETPTEKLAEANMKQGAKIYRLGDNTIAEKDWMFDFTFPKEEGDPNPHLWMNPPYVMKYAELMRDWLSERDPKNKDYYAQNQKLYQDKLTRLDQGIEVAVTSIPQQNRKLLTYHDSFAYFARRYGMDVIGAVQPSDFSEPSPKEVGELIVQVKREKVPAIFGSEVFPSKVLEQISKETGARFIDKIRDDEPPGVAESPTHTYIGMMLDDMNTMVPVLGGNVESLKGIDPADGFVRSQ